MKVKHAVAFALLGAIACGCRQASGGPSLRTIQIALPVDWITWLPVQLAQELGYAEQEGLRLSIFETTGLGKGMEALIGGSVDVTAGTLSQVIQLAAEERRVRCFLTLYSRSPIALAVSPAMSDTIRTPRDLNGRRVGVASAGSPSHQFLNFFVVSQGMPLDAVQPISVGTAAPSLAALERGTVDAGVLLGAAIPTYERRHPDARLLVDTRSPEGTRRVFGSDTFPNACLIADDGWLHADEATTRHLVRAVRRAMQWIAAHSAEEVRARMPEALHVADADAELQAIRQAQGTIAIDGAMPADAPEVMRRYMASFSDRVSAAKIDLAATYTNDFLDRP